ncbi:methyl-accepting chemotaxis protein [Cohnella suwonensis]|uniref:Methyl-accepting chemotaxis protein n=1 Tax=Cohnella suwonensis TaxID=696072 RepID=A0ABW0LW66_9BACL
MKIRMKLLLSFTLLIALLFSLGFYSFDQSKNTHSAYEKMLQKDELRFMLKSVQNALSGMSNDERAFLMTGDSEYSSGLNAKKNLVPGLVAAMKKSPSSDESDLPAIGKIESLYAAYAGFSEQTVGFMEAGKADQAKAVHFEKERIPLKQLTPQVETLLGKLNAELKQDVADRKKENDRQNVVMLLIFSSSVIAAVAIGFVLIRSITKPLKQMDKQMKGIADGDGDLSQEIVLRSKDEIAGLADTFNRMVRNLRNILSRAQETAIMVAASSEQLTASAEQTTLATEQIVEATNSITSSAEKEQQFVSETVEAMQQMSSGIQEVAVSNEEISRLARAASGASADGKNAAADVLSEMKELDDSVSAAERAIRSLGGRSKQINGISGVITDLANRTNLLSLNAGIEAARAGEHGRGFAVVAVEIRKLAEQSKTSAEQITELIGEIVSDTARAVEAMTYGAEKVALGLAKAESVNQVFTEIESNVSAVGMQVEQTSETSLRLADSGRQIVTMVEGVSDASHEVVSSCKNNSASTEEQLATMEEISSSSQALSKLAEDLHGMLSRFKLG